MSIIEEQGDGPVEDYIDLSNTPHLLQHFHF
jgi:hypothetical protein